MAADRDAAMGIVAFLVLAWAGLALFREALSGPFLSDDIGIVATNPYIRDLSWSSICAILDPWGAPALYSANWAPLHLLVHALQWQVFGDATFGYHVVNVVLHAAVTVIFALLLLDRGLPPIAAGALALVFFAHPVQVEAVAWIFQLKTLASTGLAMAALWMQPRRPGWAAALFGAALLFKASALFALPVAAVLAWVCAREDGHRRHLRWLLLWGALAAAYAAPQMFTFERLGQVESELVPEGAERLRTVFALVGRYLVIAATSWGVSTFHEPEPSRSWLDPWWLLGAAICLGIGLRTLVTLARRQPEAAFWVWAAAAYAPVSQVFPFLYPMADRYLYPVLPGLLGGAWWLARALLARVPVPVARLAPWRTVAIAAIGLLLIVFAVRTHTRAAVWRSELSFQMDAVRHYPEGLTARLMGMARAASEGDGPRAAQEARLAMERGYHRFMDLAHGPHYTLVRDDPAFREVLEEMARRWLGATEKLPVPLAEDRRFRAHAYLVLGALREAERELEEAQRLGGPQAAQVRGELRQVRALIRADETRRERVSPPSARDAPGS